VKTITLTEFNQNPSRATRLADEDDVLVLRRGTAAYRLTKVAAATDPIAALVTAGLAVPPRSARRLRTFRRIVVPDEIDVTTMLDADRNRLGY